MREVAKLLGWVVVWGFVFVMLNFVLKFINKNFISKLPSGHKKFIDTYRKVMRFFIKYHKVAGIITSLFILIHFAIMFIFVRISASGIIAFATMFSIFILGLYGAFIKKSIKGNWIKVHRFLAFLLIVFIFIHVAH